MAVDTTFKATGELVTRLCAEQGRRKDWLARQLGMASSQLSDRIHGRTKWNYLEAKELASIFGVPLEEFWPDDREREIGGES
jgi:ribosome-binding protein aMBF1 (putative translation factor)